MRVVMALRVEITRSARVRDISARMSVNGDDELSNEYL